MDEIIRYCPRCGGKDIDLKAHGSPGKAACRACETVFAVLGTPADSQDAAHALRQSTAQRAPRELTDDEVRRMLIEHVIKIIDAVERNPRIQGLREKLQLLAFDILAMLDGSSIGMPGFIVAPNPNADDEKFHREQGRDWYPSFKGEAKHDIAGELHEHFHPILRETRAREKK